MTLVASRVAHTATAAWVALLVLLRATVTLATVPEATGASFDFSISTGSKSDFQALADAIDDTDYAWMKFTQERFAGAATVGTYAVFAPSHSAAVGLFNFADLSITFKHLYYDGWTQPGQDFYMFDGALAIDKKVVLVNYQYSSAALTIVDMAESPPTLTQKNIMAQPANQDLYGDITLNFHTHFFRGGTVVGNKAVFCPYVSSGNAVKFGITSGDVGIIGVYDITLADSQAFNIFPTIDTVDVNKGALTGDYFFYGAATVGTKVVFAPFDADFVGVFNTATNRFTYYPTTGINTDEKFSGAAAVGTKVVFAPHDANSVGVFDTATYLFSLVPTGLPSQNERFRGAVALGSRVFFVPSKSFVVGVFDPETDTFSSVETSIEQEYGTIDCGSESCYSGATVMGNKIIMAPFGADKIGIVTVDMPQEPDSDDSDYTGLIIGCSVGGVALIAIVYGYKNGYFKKDKNAYEKIAAQPARGLVF